MQAELVGRPLEITGPGVGLLEHRQHEGPQQDDGVELAFALDQPGALGQVFEFGSEEPLQMMCGRAQNLHGETPSSETSLDTTRVGEGVFPLFSSPFSAKFRAWGCA